MDRNVLALDLIGAIYDAVVEPQRWQEVVSRFSETLDGSAACVVVSLPGVDGGERRFAANLGAGLAAECSKAFLDEALRGVESIDLFSRGFALASPPMAQPHDTSVLRARPPKLGELAVERPIGHLVAIEGHRPIASISAWRKQGAGAFSEADLAFADRFVPHLARACGMLRSQSSMTRQRVALAEVMNRLPVGVLLLDRKRRPVVSNRSAKRIIALDDGLSLAEGRLRAANSHDHAVLCRLFDAATAKAGDGTASNRVMNAARPSGRRAFPIIVAPLLESEPGAAAEDAVVSVLVGDPDEGQSFTSEIFRTVYDLTPAEADLVELLAEGYCLEEAAEQRGVTINTVRSQLKQIFSKTDTNRQGPLIRLILTGAATFEGE